MLAVKIGGELEESVRRLAEQTHMPRAQFVREALVSYVNDIDDYRLGQEVIARNESTMTLDELEKKLGLAH